MKTNTSSWSKFRSYILPSLGVLFTVLAFLDYATPFLSPSVAFVSVGTVLAVLSINPLIELLLVGSKIAGFFLILMGIILLFNIGMILFWWWQSL